MAGGKHTHNVKMIVHHYEIWEKKVCQLERESTGGYGEKVENQYKGIVISKLEEREQKQNK